MVVTQANFRWLSLGFRTVRGPLTMLKVFLRRFVAILLGRKMYGMGNALMIGLRKGLQDAGVPVWYGTRAHRPRPGGRTASSVPTCCATDGR